MASVHHISLWPEAKTFEILQKRDSLITIVYLLTGRWQDLVLPYMREYRQIWHFLKIYSKILHFLARFYANLAKIH